MRTKPVYFEGGPLDGQQKYIESDATRYRIAEATDSFLTIAKLDAPMPLTESVKYIIYSPSGKLIEKDGIKMEVFTNE